MNKNLVMPATFSMMNSFSDIYRTTLNNLLLSEWLFLAPLDLNSQAAFLVEFDMDNETRCGHLPKQDSAWISC